MSKVTIAGMPDKPFTAPSSLSEEILRETDRNHAPPTEELTSNENLSVDERIARAKEGTQINYNRVRERQATADKDLYKNASGKTTYYYENVSPYELAWSHATVNIPTTPLGGAVDFYDYFDKEEDILNFKTIRKNEFPNNVAPLIRRLTPEQFLNKIERNRKLEQQKNQYHVETKGKDKVSEEDKISSAVQYRVKEYLDWESRSKEEQVKSNYSKYEFIQWVMSWNFNEPEFRMMIYQVRDPEVVKAIAERKQELNSR